MPESTNVGDTKKIEILQTKLIPPKETAYVYLPLPLFKHFAWKLMSS